MAVPFVLTLLFALAAIAALLLGARQARLLAVAVPILVLLAAFFALALTAMATDYRDADGWIDCWPNCSAIQQATGAGLFYAPLVGLVVALAAIAIGLVGRRRR